MTTTLYYINADGNPETADLRIVDARSGCFCEADILGNMGFGSAESGVCMCPSDLDDDSEWSNIQRKAVAAGATHFADTEESAKWWVEYVDGYRATQDDCAEIAERLGSLDQDALDKIAAKTDAESADVGAIIVTLSEDYSEYEDERARFCEKRDTLLALIESAE